MDPLSTLLPPDVALSVARGDVAPEPLYPEEHALVARAVAVRVRHFSLGRTCARRALRQLGRSDVPIPQGARGAPVWPDDVVGSITHTKDFVAAVAASRARYVGIGLDAEAVGRVGPNLWRELFQPDEIARLEALAPARRDVVSTLLFSAREAFYKCQFQVSSAWVDFLDVGLDWGEDTFTVQVLEPIAGYADRGFRLGGRWRVDGDVVVSALAHPSGALP